MSIVNAGRGSSSDLIRGVEGNKGHLGFSYHLSTGGLLGILP